MQQGAEAEETFVIPAAWRRNSHPRRDRSPSASIKVDPSKAKATRAAINSDLARTRLDQAMGNELSEPRLVEAVRAYLNGEPDPVGAAGVLAAVTLVTPWDRAGELAGFADLWTTEHGLAFAARAICEFSGIGVMSLHEPRRYLTLRAQDRTEFGWSWDGRNVAARVRAFLAVAGEEDYLAAAGALEGLRHNNQQRVVASFLVPTRQDWVDEILARGQLAGTRVDTELVLCAVSTPEQLRALAGDEHGRGRLAETDVLYTAAVTVGPAIAPVIAPLLDDRYLETKARKHVLTVLGGLPTDEAFELLVGRLGQKLVEATLLETMARYPVRALRLLARAAGPAAAALLRTHALANAELAAGADLPADVRAAIDEIHRGRVAEASPETLPRVLTEPPWTRPRPAEVRLTGLVAAQEVQVRWQPGEQERWTRRHGSSWPDWDEAVARFRAGQLEKYYENGVFMNGPEHLVRPLLADWQPRSYWDGAETARAVAARFELDALPPVLRLAKANPATAGSALLPYLGGEIAHVMADWLVHGRSTRTTALAWFRRHGAEGVAHLVPTAFGTSGKARSTAETALSRLGEKGFADEVREAGREFGEEAAQAVEALLATDPLDLAPTAVPALPGWADPVVLPQIRLRDRAEALPTSTAAQVITMLAMSTVDQEYPGMPLVREACDPGSLAEFAWGLFERWRSAGCPAKEGWALTALGRLGDDDTVRRLAPVIRAWPGEGGHARAVTGLDVLALIGTDVALTHLHSISLKVKFKALRERAADKIGAVAAELGLSAEQLADRLVPDLGLDDRGSLTLDYGPRAFTVGFDEQLKPYVLDGEGKRRKDLPKPGAKDDPELAPAAHRRFGQLKKDVRAIAADQIIRLERAMVARRRWRTEEFRALFVGHPLLWHLVRRLVWLAERDGQVVATFRIAEDRTLADVHDDPFTLPDDVTVGIAHALELTEAGNWGEVFADYEILQPFRQLGRPVHMLSEDERTSGKLKRFEGVTVPVGKVLGLTKKGWERATPQDAGVEPWISRPVPGGVVVLALYPGIAVGAVADTPEQTVEHAWLDTSEASYCRPFGAPHTFPELDPVTASEVLTELVELTS